MNRSALVCSMILWAFAANAQTYMFYQTDNIHNQLRLNSITGEVYQIQNDGQRFLVHAGIVHENSVQGRYTLHKTKNMWTYILLDTFTGKLWQCQFSVDGIDYIASWIINGTALSASQGNKFTIQALTSMYQYYLINQENGEMWKFQWTTKEEDGYRWIEKI